MDLNHNPTVPKSGTTGFASEQGSVVKNDMLTGLIRLTIFISFIFLIFPVADIIVSGWFADAAGKFQLHENSYLLALRDLHRLLPAVIVPVLLLGVVVQAVSYRNWLPAPHKLLYILSVYAIGAAAVVHSLKYLVGRARPNEIMEYGGTMLFSPAWQIAQSCQNSCSFPSGEGASSMAMLAIPLILGGVYRLPLLIVTTIAALVFSLNRIIMGAHFLSDVMLSWLFVAIVMAWLWPVFKRNGARIDNAVAKAGRRIRAIRF